MDKKQITGLVLIFAIFVGYMWWISPSKEERAAMMAQRDSIVQAYNDSIYNDSVLRAETELKLQAQRDSILAVNPDALADFEADAAGIVNREEKAKNLGRFACNIASHTDTIRVKNQLIDVNLTNLGAAVNTVVLKDYFTYDSLPLQLINPSEENMDLVFLTNDNRQINTKDLHFTPYVNGNELRGNQEFNVEGDSLVLCYRAFAQSYSAEDTLAHEDVLAKDKYVEFRYTFYPGRYDVGFHIGFQGLSDLVSTDNRMDFQWKNRMNRQEKVDQSVKGSRNRNKDAEKFNSNVYYKPVKDNVDNLKLGRNDSKQVKTSVEWVAFKQQFFCAIMMGSTPFENADLDINTNESDTARNYLCDMSSTTHLTYADNYDFQFYYGPTKYRDLRAMHKGFERMLPLGWGFFLIHWTSRAIIACLNFLEQFNLNYGIIIIIITLLLRLVLLPLVIPSYKSSAVMRILRPEMEALNKKYPNQDQALQKQQEMTRLQKAAGINPMLGCLPALIQLPILWAMFRFFPASIELRQKSFLWCDDLSTYDSILDLGFNVPFGYGDHISLFCLIMFGVQFFYTWYTMKSQPQSASMPGMKFMMYFMPFMMLFIFNSQSAALNMYYAVSLSLTMVIMILIRKFTSEQKVRARMVAYQNKQTSKARKNGGKKSKFQQRLEEMQKQMEELQKQQQQQQRR